MSLIFLIGYMGCGKSSTGKRLATKLSYRFVDLDQLIAQEYKMSISQIFNTLGEDQLRIWEQQALHSCFSYQNTVVALGGGTPCFFDNMTQIQQHGFSIYLQMPASILVNRLQNAKTQRPLLQSMNAAEMHDFIKIHLVEREKYYLRANLVFLAHNLVLTKLIEKIKMEMDK
jgi:shikimate kinase